MPFRPFLSLLVFLIIAGPAAAADPELDEHLTVFRPLLGKTFRGEFAGGDKSVDVAKWERALNGKAIRVLHSVNDGVYGGESIIRWDPEQKQIVSHYFTTAGFMTTGVLAVDGKKFSSVEKVAGSSGKITEVRAVTELREDGTMHVKAEYFKDGRAGGAREVTYKEDAKAEVKFR